MIKLDKAHKIFIEHLEGEGKTESTLVAYSKDIEQLMEHLAREGVDLVTEIELDHLEGFMKRLENQDYTPKSISRKTNATKTFFKFLHTSGQIKENVADRLKHPKVKIKEPRVLSKLEYRALRDAAKDDLRSYAMIEVLLQTGITISELSEIKLEHMKLEDSSGSLFISAKNNKDARTIPLNKAVIQAIKNYMEKERENIGSDFLFITKTGKPILVRNIRSTINRYFKKAGVESAKVNDLRHTFVAHHLTKGVSILHISKIAGHKRISTTERYLQYIERESEEEKTDLGIL